VRNHLEAHRNEPASSLFLCGHRPRFCLLRTPALTWSQVSTLNAQSKLLPKETATFISADLSTYSPSLADLDKFTANLRLNGGRLSFFIKRWCNGTVRYTNNGLDDYNYKANSFAISTLSSVTCHPKAVCSGATCVCGTNFFGDGFSCSRATCTNNVVPGYFFDASEVVNAGEDAVTATCPPGLAGNATRRCLWNGPLSESGVWADPINNCHPVSCTTDVAYNATFNSVLIGSSSGACLSGFAGTITRVCLYNATSGTAYWGEPVGACKPISCGGGEYDNAEWPSWEPKGQDVYVNATTCKPGYQPDDLLASTQRLCTASGVFNTTIINPCKRTCSCGWAGQVSAARANVNTLVSR